MTDLYFKIKLIGSAIFIGLVVSIFLFIFINSWVSALKEKRIEKYLTSIGYKRELISTASFGTNHTYGYKRYKDGRLIDIVRDSELQGKPFKQIKREYV